MITQADIDNAKAAVDNARNLLEGYWNGNPDGNYSVMGWLSELAKCNQSNATIIARQPDLTFTIAGAPQKGSCNNNTFDLRVKNLNDRIAKYGSAYADWQAKINDFNKLVEDFGKQTTSTSTAAGTQLIGAQTQLVQAQAWAKKYQTILIVVAVLAFIGISIFIYFKWIRK